MSHEYWFFAGGMNVVLSNLTKGSGTNLSAVIYGNFSVLPIGTFGQLEILFDTYTDFPKGTGCPCSAVHRYRCS